MARFLWRTGIEALIINFLLAVLVVPWFAGLPDFMSEPRTLIDDLRGVPFALFIVSAVTFPTMLAHTVIMWSAYSFFMRLPARLTRAASLALAILFSALVINTDWYGGEVDAEIVLSVVAYGWLSRIPLHKGPDETRRTADMRDEEDVLWVEAAHAAE